jgi:ribosome-associated protein
VSERLSIPLKEVNWRATPSGGPGGQHANRTKSRVDVWFTVRDSRGLSSDQKERLIERYGPVVRVSASEERSQSRNREVAIDRLASRIALGLRVKPVRSASAPTRSSKERRLAEKHTRARVKQARARPGEDD